MKKILMYSTAKLFGENRTGGIKRFLELYEYLRKNNNVDLYCSDSEDILKKNKVERKYKLNLIKTKNIFIPTGLITFFANYKIIKNIKKENYDKIIVFDIHQAIYLSLLNLQNINLFLRQDFISYRKIMCEEYFKSKILKKLYLQLMVFCEAICLKKANKIVVQCKYDKEELIKRHKKLKEIIEKKIYIQINNVNPSWMRKKIEINLIKEDAKDFKIGFIGNFSDRRKGHELLLEVFVDILEKENKKNINLIIIGAGKDLEKYMQLYKKYTQIKFLGRRENPFLDLKECNLMVVPSLADSCPNTLLESIYNEIPVIASNVGGIPEILEDKDALFDLKKEDLKEKILKYMDENNLRKLKEKQKKQREKLSFNWGKKIFEIIGES